MCITVTFIGSFCQRLLYLGHNRNDGRSKLRPGKYIGGKLRYPSFASLSSQFVLLVEDSMAAYGSELSRLVDELNRSTTATRTGENASIDRLLALAMHRGASDVILVAGSAIALRVRGSLTTVSGKPLSAEDIRSLLLPLLTARRSEQLETDKSLDFCFERS